MIALLEVISRIWLAAQWARASRTAERRIRRQR